MEILRTRACDHGNVTSITAFKFPQSTNRLSPSPFLTGAIKVNHDEADSLTDVSIINIPTEWLTSPDGVGVTGSSARQMGLAYAVSAVDLTILARPGLNLSYRSKSAAIITCEVLASH